MADSSSPCYVDITVSVDDEDTAWQLIHALKPDWSREELQEKSFSHGFINKLICYYQKDDEHMSDAIVMRVYSLSVEDREGREREFFIAQIAHAAGCFPRIYASFNNGFVYQYAIGRSPNYHDITKPEFICKFARNLYAFHNFELKELSLKNLRGVLTTYDPVFVTVEQKGMATLIPDNPESRLDPEGLAKFKLYRNEFTKDSLAKEFQFMKEILDEVSMPVSLCHMDLHPHNMLLDPATGDITLIDFEFSGCHYTQYDLAYLFGIRAAFERMGYIGPDEPAFTDECRSMYLREYLHAKYEAKGADVNSIPQEEFELLDIHHKMLDTLISLQGISCFLALGCMTKKSDLFDHIPHFKEKYFAEKKELPILQDRCAKLMEKLANVNTE